MGGCQADSLCTQSPGRWSATVMPRVHVPVSSTRIGHCRVSSPSGSITLATAPASPMEVSVRSKLRSMKSISRPASCALGLSLSTISATSAAENVTCVKTSHVYSVTSRPLVRTISAASGSCRMLNSPTADAFPDPTAPPIRTIR